MTEENSAQWHDEPTDYGQIGKLPRYEAASANDEKASMVSSSLSITAAATEPELLDLPWHIALEDWPAEYLAALPRGISRHIVRFAHLGGSVIAIKETSEHVARHEYHMLRKLARLQKGPGGPPISGTLRSSLQAGDLFEGNRPCTVKSRNVCSALAPF